MAVIFQKTFFKTLLRDISQSLGRFVATFAIIALGVGFLAGLLATTPDMKVSADRYFDKTNMMDLFIKGTMGLTGEDRDALAALDEVASVQGAYVTDALVHIAGDQTLVARIYGLALENIGERDFINRMELLEGRMPLEDNECLVQQGGGFFADLAPGTTLTIEDTEDPGVYARTSYTVTGIVKSPLYLSTEREPSRIGNGRLGAVLYVREQAYALGVYTDFYLTLRGAAELSAFTEAYQKLVDSGISKIEALAKERSAIRHGEILAEARKTAAGRLDEAEAAYREGVRAAELELEGARKKLDDGKADLIQGEAELAGAEERIARGRAALEEEEARAARDLADNERALAEGEAEIARAKRTLAESKARLDLAKEEVERARASRIGRASSRVRKGIAQYDEGLAAWEAGRAAVAEKEAELRQARDLLEAGKVRARGEFLRAREELDAGEEELRSGRARLASAREELLRGEAEYAAARADALAELRAGREGLDEARRNMADIDIAPPQWYVLDRNANVGCVNYKANAEKIADVAKVFPIFFLLVAALVALTTMTRMIEEKRTQIGVLKALGYQKRVIIAKYLVYCGLISILGSAAGMVSGFQGIPIIIYQAFGTMYHLPPLVTKFNWTFGLIACASTLGCITGVTLFASCGALWEKPAALMVPRAPRAGKRILLEYIPLIWRPLKFTYKVTARNLIRYKKHFFMTVTGIAGCTALMVTGFGLRDSLIDIARTQFEELLAYDLRIGLREDGGRDGVLEEFLNDAGNYAEMHSETVSLMDDDGVEIHATLYVPKVPEDLSGYIKLRDRKTRRPLPFSGSSVVLTEKMAAALKLRPGDRFIPERGDGKGGALTLSGITENYVGNYIYAAPGEYLALFGEGLAWKTLFVRTAAEDAEDRDRILTRVLSSDAVAEAEFTSHTQQSYTNLLNSIDFVVLVLIFAAGGLAMIVLYNLTYININERSRELATLRVLGFHQGEAAAYIFREITILSITGAAVGLLLGIPLHRFVVGVAENVDLMFGRHIRGLSYLLSALITLVFSFGVDLLMVNKIRRIKMAESMKAID